MRLFVGIELNENVKIDLSAAADAWRQSVQASFSRKEMYHLTLAFIGEVPVEKRTLLQHTLSRVYFSPFAFRLGDAGSFPARVLYCGVRSPAPALYSLRERVASCLQEDGWAFDDRAYVPHITLARQAKGMGAAPTMPSALVKVSSFALFESARRQGRLCYTPIWRKEAEE